MAPRPAIDLNADLGEGAGFDEELLDIVTSANVACGAHAGDPEESARTCRAAAARGVVVGAHPGHADREHLGRRPLPIEPLALAALLAAQYGVVAAAGAPRYLKLHGALYHQVAGSASLADCAVRFAERHELAILGPPGSVLLDRCAQAGLPGVAEGFVDRGYHVVDGRPELVPRGAPGALLAEDDAVAQAVRIATTRSVLTTGGVAVALPVASLCVHGDTPDAVRIAARVRSALEQAGVQLRAFAA